MNPPKPNPLWTAGTISRRPAPEYHGLRTAAAPESRFGRRVRNGSAYPASTANAGAVVPPTSSPMCRPIPQTALSQVTYDASVSPAPFVRRSPWNLRPHPYHDLPPLPCRDRPEHPGSPTGAGFRRVPAADVTSPPEVRYSFPVAAVRGGHGRLPEWSKGAVCKTVGSAYAGSSPAPATPAETALSPAKTRCGGCSRMSGCPWSSMGIYGALCRIRAQVFRAWWRPRSGA